VLTSVITRRRRISYFIPGSPLIVGYVLTVSTTFTYDPIQGMIIPFHAVVIHYFFDHS
jgi:hypothetical protein